MRIFLECVPYVARRDLITNTKKILLAPWKSINKCLPWALPLFCFSISQFLAASTPALASKQNKTPGPWTKCCERLVCPTMMLTLSNTTSWQTHEKRITYYILHFQSNHKLIKSDKLVFLQCPLTTVSFIHSFLFLAGPGANNWRLVIFLQSFAHLEPARPTS